MTNEKFIKIANHDIYINPNIIVQLDCDGHSEFCEAICLMGNKWERVKVYKKDVEHLIK